jgi:hypothetical protein
MLRDDATYAPLRLFEYDHEPGTYCLMLTDEHAAPVEAVFAAHDREPGGYGWADVAIHWIRTSAPELEDRLGLDPEAGMFVAHGKDLAALQALGAALRDAYHDHTRLDALVAAAPYEYD